MNLVYYWDSFWIIKGLLICEMFHTAKGMIENLLNLVEKYGFVPNGNRSYYLNRSQPPLLSEMVMEYYKATTDLDFLKAAVPILKKEYIFFMTSNSAVEVVDVEQNKHVL